MIFGLVKIVDYDGFRSLCIDSNEAFMSRVKDLAKEDSTMDDIRALKVKSEAVKQIDTAIRLEARGADFYGTMPAENHSNALDAKFELEAAKYRRCRDLPRAEQAGRRFR